MVASSGVTNALLVVLVLVGVVALVLANREPEKARAPGEWRPGVTPKELIHERYGR